MNRSKEVLILGSAGVLAILSVGCQQPTVSKDIRSIPTSEPTPKTQQLSREQKPPSLLTRFLAADLRYRSFNLQRESITFVDEEGEEFEVAGPSYLPGAIVLMQGSRGFCAPATDQAKQAFYQLGRKYNRGDVVSDRRSISQATQNTGSCDSYMIRKHQSR